MTGLMLFSLPPNAYAVDLGAGVASFAVLGGQGVTNTGTSVLNASVGVSPGSSITGFPPGIVNNGTEHRADSVSDGAQAELTTAYNEAASSPPTQNVTGRDLGGLRLLPGVYKANSSMGLTGTVTLDARGNEDAEFIFQAGSTLTTGSGASVSLLNGAQACNVFWQVGSSATVGSATAFVGTIMALTSITVQSGATVEGRALARNGQVTLDDNVFTQPGCEPNDGIDAVDDDDDDDDGDDDSGDDDGGTTPGPNPGPRDGQNTQPNSSGPQGGSSNSGDDTSTDDDSSDDLVTVTESGSAPPVVPSGNPDTGLAGVSDSNVGTGWLAAGLLALGGAAAAGIYGYRPLRPARVRRR